MLQKCLSFLFCLLVFCDGAMAAAGSMWCKVKSNDLIIMEDGTAKKYVGYSGGIEVGNTLILKYQASTEGVKVFVDNQSKQDPRTRIATIINRTDKDFRAAGIDASAYNSEGGAVSSGYLMNVAAYHDRFSFKGALYEAELERYYKSDWHGLIYGKIGLKAHVLGINCTHNNDDLEQFIKTIRAY